MASGNVKKIRIQADDGTSKMAATSLLSRQFSIGVILP
jgi:hypothetical protein